MREKKLHIIYPLLFNQFFFLSVLFISEIIFNVQEKQTVSIKKRESEGDNQRRESYRNWNIAKNVVIICSFLCLEKRAELIASKQVKHDGKIPMRIFFSCVCVTFDLRSEREKTLFGLARTLKKKSGDTCVALNELQITVTMPINLIKSDWLKNMFVLKYQTDEHFFIRLKRKQINFSTRKKDNKGATQTECVKREKCWWHYFFQKQKYYTQHTQMECFLREKKLWIIIAKQRLCINIMSLDD